MTNTTTAETLLERWKARREIETLMGRRTNYILMKKETKEWEELWCRQASDPCLGDNTGYYKGYDAIGAYFRAKYDRDLERAAQVQAKEPALAGQETAELLGVGSLNIHALTTPIIEIARDMRTAKGMWYVVGALADVGAGGVEGAWARGRLAVDFVHESGVWKIWHLFFAVDVLSKPGQSWPESNIPVESFAAMEQALPAPSVIQEQFVSYNWERQLAPDFLPVPEPYDTFDETFSYGV